MPFRMPSVRTQGARQVNVPQQTVFDQSGSIIMGHAANAVKGFMAQKKEKEAEKAKKDAISKENSALIRWLDRGWVEEEKGKNIARRARQEYLDNLPGGWGQEEKGKNIARDARQKYLDNLPIPAANEPMSQQQYSEMKDIQTGTGVPDPSPSKFAGLPNDVLRKMIGDQHSGKGPLVQNVMNAGESKYGTIPPGYELIKNKDGSVYLAPIEGSPAWQEIQAKEDQAKKRDDTGGIYADAATQDIDRAIQLIDRSVAPVSGFWGGALAKVWGTTAHDISELVGAVRTQITFDRLKQIRDNKTGGGLGQISDFENRMMGLSLGSLEQSQNQEQFRDNLLRVKAIYVAIATGESVRQVIADKAYWKGENKVPEVFGKEEVGKEEVGKEEVGKEEGGKKKKAKKEMSIEEAVLQFGRPVRLDNGNTGRLWEAPNGESYFLGGQ